MPETNTRQEDELWFDALVTFKHSHTQYNQGERCKEPASLVRYFCEQGWAKELSGQVATGAPATGETKLDIPNTVQGQKGKVN